MDKEPSHLPKALLFNLLAPRWMVTGLAIFQMIFLFFFTLLLWETGVLDVFFHYIVVPMFHALGSLIVNLFTLMFDLLTGACFKPGVCVQ